MQTTEKNADTRCTHRVLSILLVFFGSCLRPVQHGHLHMEQFQCPFHGKYVPRRVHKQADQCMERHQCYLHGRYVFERRVKFRKRLIKSTKITQNGFCNNRGSRGGTSTNSSPLEWGPGARHDHPKTTDAPPF